MSPQVVIYKYKPDNPVATSSSDLNSIELGKTAIILLAATKGEYKVMSISYLPPSTQPSPKAKTTR